MATQAARPGVGINGRRRIALSRAAGSSIGMATIVAIALNSAYAAAQIAPVPACTPHIARWSSFDVPGTGTGIFSGTKPIAINDFGEVAGTWDTNFHDVHGFLRDPNGTIVSFDPPNGGGGTFVAGINDRGEIVGAYVGGLAEHGFIRSANGSFTIVDDPDPSTAATVLSGVNDWGVAVGYWRTASGTVQQGLVRHADGSITNITGSGAFVSINDLGEASGVTSNFSSGLLLGRDGTRVVWAPPPGAGLGLTGLNIKGSVAFYGGLPDGFVRHANGHFTAISPSVPAYNEVTLGTINNRGTVVGFEYSTASGAQQGFAQLADGTRVPVNAPVAGQQGTTPTAINDRNVLTGSWLDSGGLFHGFVATLVSCD